MVARQEGKINQKLPGRWENHFFTGRGSFLTLFQIMFKNNAGKMYISARSTIQTNTVFNLNEIVDRNKQQKHVTRHANKRNDVNNKHAKPTHDPERFWNF